MITNSGKQLVAKYLLGQAPAYATYLAAGVGYKALSTGETLTIPPTKQSLDFEAFRVPITSKGFIKEDGVEKIIFKAEMPSEQRYQITELGVYPAISNAVAGKYDSKLLLTFSPTEQWQYVINGSASAITYPNEAIDSDNLASDINANIEDVLFINSDSTMFNNETRRNRNEGPRFLNTALMVSGSVAFLSPTFIPSTGSMSLENANINFDLGQNLPDDKIKLAFSLVSRAAATTANPDEVRIYIQFINSLSGTTVTAPKATLKILLNGSDFTDESSNVMRYMVVEKTLSQFVKDDNFSWSNVNYIKIHATVIDNDAPTEDYYIVFDGMRLENVTSENPLYSLFAYNVLQTSDGYPILKQENTSNYIEYRFGIGVDG